MFGVFGVFGQKNIPNLFHRLGIFLWGDCYGYADADGDASGS